MDFFHTPAYALQNGDHVSAPTADGHVVLWDVSHVATVGGMIRFHAGDKAGGGVRRIHTIGRDTDVAVLRPTN